jgi:hypothetical protein
MLRNLRCTGLVASSLLLAAGLALAAKAPKAAPPPPALPRPTGMFAVGTTVAYLTDSTRTAGPPGAEFPRPITVQLWYPTNDSTGARESYLVEPGLATAAVSSRLLPGRHDLATRVGRARDGRAARRAHGDG